MMVAMAMMESTCLRGIGAASSTIVNNGGHSSNASRSAGSCSVPVSPLRATSAGMQVETSRSGGRSDDHAFWPNLGSKVKLRSIVHVARSTLADTPSVAKKPQDLFTVGDFMTRLDELHVATTRTTVDEALEILVEKRITGLPVVDDEGRLVGVVSDYDLLALDSISGKRSDEGSLFPAANSTWKAFKEIQLLLGKTHGKTVGELMSPSPLVVREMTNIEDAARILLETKFRRLPVVSDTGKLVGLLTRGNVVRAALIIKRAHESSA